MCLTRRKVNYVETCINLKNKSKKVALLILNEAILILKKIQIKNVYR